MDVLNKWGEEMSRLIDADALIERMYHDAFETDTDMQKWDSGCWIRYKLFENAIDDAPTIDAVSEWIPCSKRLPSNFSEDETVLATTDVDGDRVIAMFALDVKSFYLKGYVSTWMPLPAPWKGADDE